MDVRTVPKSTQTTTTQGTARWDEITHGLWYIQENIEKNDKSHCDAYYRCVPKNHEWAKLTFYLITHVIYV
uniref:Uncharacterized protein n=1 Tax=Megaselia scalaris TaxID=36166 RepID=T1GH09_MEGSC